VNNTLSNIELDVNGQSVTIYLETGRDMVGADHPESTDGTFTLEDVYETYKFFDGLIYVFADGGLRGKIYRCNNYGKGIWQEYAITQGYA